MLKPMMVLDGMTLPASPAVIAATPNISGVVRYVAPQAWNWPKALTPTELQSIRAANLPIAFNYETDGKSWRGGYNQGFVDGRNCWRAMKDLGLFPHSIYYTPADEDITNSDYPALADCLNGFNKAYGFLCDAYLTHDAADYCRWAKVVNRTWQINARGWTGNLTDDPNAALIQHTSHSFPQFPPSLYDESTVQSPDWGQLSAPPHPHQKVHKMFQLFQIKDAPAGPQAAAVWATDGVTRSWVQSPASRDALMVLAGSQGLPTNIAELTMAQVSTIPVIGPEPS